MYSVRRGALARPRPIGLVHIPGWPQFPDEGHGWGTGSGGESVGLAVTIGEKKEGISVVDGEASLPTSPENCIIPLPAQENNC